MSTSPIRNVVRFSGHVQGVGFRMTAVALAAGLDVHGYVRNEPDGNVEMDVEGSPRDVRELVRRIESEMRGNIDHTTVDERPVTGQRNGFRIRY